MNVLVADDNYLNQQLFSAFLKRIGWNCALVDNGLQAVEACMNTMYDAVLMDIDMPLLNGIEATRAIREFNLHLPIIALTAFTEDSVRLASTGAGMNDFLAKPVSRDDIVNSVLNCIEKNKMKVA